MLECLVMPGYVFEVDGKLMKVKRSATADGKWACGPADALAGSTKGMVEMSTAGIRDS